MSHLPLVPNTLPASVCPHKLIKKNRKKALISYIWSKGTSLGQLYLFNSTVNIFFFIKRFLPTPQYPQNFGHNILPIRVGQFPLLFNLVHCLVVETSWQTVVVPMVVVEVREAVVSIGSMSLGTEPGQLQHSEGALVVTFASAVQYPHVLKH